VTLLAPDLAGAWPRLLLLLVGTLALGFAMLFWRASGPWPAVGATLTGPAAAVLAQA